MINIQVQVMAHQPILEKHKKLNIKLLMQIVEQMPG
jgi:hypothetical protein